MQTVLVLVKGIKSKMQALDDSPALSSAQALATVIDCFPVQISSRIRCNATDYESGELAYLATRLLEAEVPATMQSTAEISDKGSQEGLQDLEVAGSSAASEDDRWMLRSYCSKKLLNIIQCCTISLNWSFVLLWQHDELAKTFARSRNLPCGSLVKALHIFTSRVNLKVLTFRAARSFMCTSRASDVTSTLPRSW